MQNEEPIFGVIIPMLSPFMEDGEIDIDASKKMARRLVEAGTIPFVLGTTGEAFSIHPAKRETLLKAVLEEVADGSQVYAGVPSNSLAQQLEIANRYFDLGVTAVVAHLPCYYRIEPENMLRYYELLSGGLNGKLIIYNIPKTTGMEIPLEVVDELSHRDNIIAVKDTMDDKGRMTEALKKWASREDFAYLLGHEPLMAEGLSAGAGGVVAAVGNIVPVWCRKLYETVTHGALGNAERLNSRIMKVRQAYSSLAGLKYAASLLELCCDSVLPPLFPLDDEHKKMTAQELTRLGIIVP